jgi:hypothetical protein
VHPLRLSASSLASDALVTQILEQLQLPAFRQPREVLQRHVERMHLEGSRLALLVDEGDRLPADAVRWLLSLANDGTTRTPVVLVTTDFARCLRALAGSGSCVSLVRLGSPAFAPRATGGAPELIEPEVVEVVSAAAAAPELPAPLESPTPDPLPDPEPAGPWREPLRSVEELLADLDPSQLLEARAEPVRTTPIRVSDPQPDPIRILDPPRPTPARIVPASSRAQPEPASRSQPQPQSLRVERSWRWLGLAAAVAIAALGLTLWLLSVGGDASDGRQIPTRSSGDRSPVATRAAEDSAAPPREAELPRSLEQADLGGEVGVDVSDADVVVSDVRQAITLLAKSDDARVHAAATQLLAKRGPDPVGYELLADLDGRRAANPGDAVQILTARARVRAALCAAWAHDPSGEAAVRLGCPGAGSPSH